MSNLGLGVMIQKLSGNKDTIDAITNSIGKELSGLELVEDTEDKGWRDQEDHILFTFTDNTKMRVWDAGQSCCELRYMHTDDVLQDFVGATLTNLELRDAPMIEDDCGEPHEVQFLVVTVQFLVVTTSKGAFTIETHNEHNGYYGGFAVKALLVA